ncbi:MAG: UvrD-helicase domain-containing protein [Cyclobacteriaceae bacterium]
MPEAPFHIYRSSAGSGKTFTLSREYLKLALTRPGAFRKILGVTFTNKASEEMKRRIIDYLKDISDGNENPMTAQLLKALGISAEVLQQKAASTLTDILHNYGRFSVVTIDSFFHQVIRSFAREMGLQGTFTIDLDLDKVMQEVIDQMLLEIGEEEHKQLRAWLSQFAEQKVEEGQSWDFRRDIASLAREILRDDFKQHASSVLKLSAQPDFFENFRKELNQRRYQFENHVKGIHKEVDQYLTKNQIDPNDFSRKMSGPIGLFYKVIQKDDPKKQYDISSTRRDAVEDKGKWLTKANMGNAVLHQALDELIMLKYQELVSFIDNHLVEYVSVLEVQRYLYTFGILAEINRYLTRYREEQDVMLIADLPDFLRQIIHDSETPYIYEKIGSIFSHYLIDEFQDTSVFQWNNFKPLVKNSTDEGEFSMIVGDVKQSIYRFRGGDWELFQHRVKSEIGEYHVKEDTLAVNYRSSARLVQFNNLFFQLAQDQANDFFASMANDIPDADAQQETLAKLENIFSAYSDVTQESPPGKDPGLGEVDIAFIEDEDLEEGWNEEAIHQTIKQVEHYQRQGYELRDMAILTRYAKEGKRIADAFIAYRNSAEADENLRYEVVSSEALYLTSSHLVRFIVSLIEWMNDESNTIVLSQWLYEYRHYIKGDSDAGSQSALFADIQGWKQKVPAEFVRQKNYLKTLPLYELVENIIRIFGLDKQVEEFTYLQGFQDAVLDYTKNERGDIPSFLEWWEEVRKDRAIQIADENNAIKILTIHKAKGLEFPVVIIPFLSWLMDNEYNKDNILWVKGGDREPFNQLPTIPLKYTTKLIHTYWAAEFYDERLKAFIDSLNLLYVAFTRPIDVLWVRGLKPRNPDKLKTVGELVYSQLGKLDGWNEEKYQLHWGEMKRQEAPVSGTLEFGLDQYFSHPWRGKVSLQIKGSAELSEAVFIEATQRGIALHAMLSRIRYKEDVRPYLGTSEEEAIREIVEHPDLADWFEPQWKVENEVGILLPGGDFKRIDRVNYKEDETVVIDFKTGSPRSKDKSQVKEYMDILGQMGFPGIKGRLVYLTDFNVMEV